MANSTRSPYTTLGPLLSGLPSWLQGYGGDDVMAQRWRSCEIYRDMYWDEPKTFVLNMRGSDNRPIYLPSARVVVETAHRYTAKDFKWRFSAASVGTDQEKLQVQATFDNLFRREQFKAKFAAQKREALIKGDWFWHIVANPTAAPNRRISIYEVNAEQVIWITHPDDESRIIGCHIVEMVREDDKDAIKRQTYLKLVDSIGNVTGIESSCGIWELDKVFKDGAQPMRWITNPVVLDPLIKSIPVYQVKNRRQGIWPYGASALKGFETILSAINQGITDEELSLVLDGIGVYATDSGSPVDDDGNETDWVIAGGRVVELDDGKTFERITGIASVEPWRAHEGALRDWLYEGSGTPGFARGVVDVSVAQSGIALKLQAGPLIAQVDERNDEILATHDNMYYDLLHMWFPAYEKESGVSATTQLIIEPVVGETIPKDEEQRLQDVIALHTAQLVDTKWAHDQLTALGWDMEGVNIAGILSEMKARAEAVDVVGAALGGLGNAAAGAGDPNAAPAGGAPANLNGAAGGTGA